ncbi:MAG: 2-oxoacid:acceptor oxidoreductase family protein, partial [Candidatus Lokiarchaeota archaeon]
YAGPQTNFIINDKLIIPPMIHQQGLEYPSISEIRKFLSDVSKNIYFIPADDLASKAGNQRTMNVVMLGVLVGMHQIPIANDTIFNSIMKFIPKKTIKVNKIAFDLGIERGNEIRGQNNE